MRKLEHSKKQTGRMGKLESSGNVVGNRKLGSLNISDLILRLFVENVKKNHVKFREQIVNSVKKSFPESSYTRKEDEDLRMQMQNNLEKYLNYHTSKNLQFQIDVYDYVSELVTKILDDFYKNPDKWLEMCKDKNNYSKRIYRNYEMFRITVYKEMTRKDIVDSESKRMYEDIKEQCDRLAEGESPFLRKQGKYFSLYSETEFLNYENANSIKMINYHSLRKGVKGKINKKELETLIKMIFEENKYICFRASDLKEIVYQVCGISESGIDQIDDSYANVNNQSNQSVEQEEDNLTESFIKHFNKEFEQAYPNPKDRKIVAFIYYFASKEYSANVTNKYIEDYCGWGNTLKAIYERKKRFQQFVKQFQENTKDYDDRSFAKAMMKIVQELLPVNLIAEIEKLELNKRDKKRIKDYEKN